MSPSLRDELKISDLQAICTRLDERIARQDSTPPEKSCGPSTPIPDYEVNWVGCIEAAQNMLDELINEFLDVGTHGKPDPTLFLDLEGHGVGRDGTLSLMQIYNPNISKTYLLDIYTLGQAAFTACSTVNPGVNLKVMLEGYQVRKVLKDCRADSDALSAHHGVYLHPASVEDVQHLELASESKPRDRRKLKGLARAVRQRLNVPQAQRDEWHDFKDHGRKHMNGNSNDEVLEATDAMQRAAAGTPSHVENTDTTQGPDKREQFSTPTETAPDVSPVWEQRPLPNIMIKHACGDVTVLPLLLAYCSNHSKLTEDRLAAVRFETRKRVMESRRAVKGEHKKEAPMGWDDKDW